MKNVLCLLLLLSIAFAGTTLGEGVPYALNTPAYSFAHTPVQYVNALTGTMNSQSHDFTQGVDANLYDYYAASNGIEWNNRLIPGENYGEGMGYCSFPTDGSQLNFYNVNEGNPSIQYAQSFTSDSSFSTLLREFKVRARKYNSGGSNINVALRTDRDGANLWWGAAPLTQSTSLQTLTFTPNYQMQKNTVYYIVFWIEGTKYNTYIAMPGGTCCYPIGNPNPCQSDTIYRASSNNGGGWVNVGGTPNDLEFSALHSRLFVPDAGSTFYADYEWGHSPAVTVNSIAKSGNLLTHETSITDADADPLSGSLCATTADGSTLASLHTGGADVDPLACFSHVEQCGTAGGANVLYATDGSGIWYYDGSTWSSLDVPAEFQSIYSLEADGTALLVGGVGASGGAVQRYSSGVWTDLTTAPFRSATGNIIDIAILGGDYYVLDSYNDYAFRYHSGAWDDITPLSPYEYTSFKDIEVFNGGVWAAGQQYGAGKLLHLVNVGPPVVWEEIPLLGHFTSKVSKLAVAGSSIYAGGVSGGDFEFGEWSAPGPALRFFPDDVNTPLYDVWDMQFWSGALYVSDENYRLFKHTGSGDGVWGVLPTVVTGVEVIEPFGSNLHVLGWDGACEMDHFDVNGVATQDGGPAGCGYFYYDAAVAGSPPTDYLQVFNGLDATSCAGSAPHGFKFCDAPCASCPFGAAWSTTYSLLGKSPSTHFCVGMLSPTEVLSSWDAEITAYATGVTVSYNRVGETALVTDSWTSGELDNGVLSKTLDGSLPPTPLVLSEAYNFNVVASDGQFTTISNEWFVWQDPVPCTLSDDSGGVTLLSPSAGQGDDEFTYSVFYQDSDGVGPDDVFVYIDGVPYPMTTLGSDFITGVTYAFSTSAGPCLTEGTHEYSFAAYRNGETDCSYPPTPNAGPAISAGASCCTFEVGELTFGYHPKTSNELFFGFMETDRPYAECQILYGAGSSLDQSTGSLLHDPSGTSYGGSITGLSPEEQYSFQAQCYDASCFATSDTKISYTTGIQTATGSDNEELTVGSGDRTCTVSFNGGGGASAHVTDYGSNNPELLDIPAGVTPIRFYDLDSSGSGAPFDVGICWAAADDAALDPASLKLYYYDAGTWTEHSGTLGSDCYTVNGLTSPAYSGVFVGGGPGGGGPGGPATGGRTYSAPAFSAWDLVLFFALAVMIVIAFLAVNPTNKRRKK